MGAWLKALQRVHYLVTICRRYGQSTTAKRDTQFVHVKSHAKTAVLCDMMPPSLVCASTSLPDCLAEHIPESHNPYSNSHENTKSHKSLGKYHLQLTKDCQKRKTHT